MHLRNHRNENQHLERLECVLSVYLVVCRSVKASHVLISADGQVCMSGLRSIFSLIRHGQRARVVHDFPQYSVKVLPWLSPEVLQQVPPPAPLLHRTDPQEPHQHFEETSNVSSLRTFRVTIPGRIFTASESQPVNWPTDTCPSRTCPPRRWGADGPSVRMSNDTSRLLPFQMLLEKLNGTVPCLLDTTTIPPEELALKPSRSGADSGICEGPGGGIRHSNGEPSSSSGHPYNRTFSPHFHAFVELCLQRDPEKRFLLFFFIPPRGLDTRVNVAAGLSGFTPHSPCCGYLRLLCLCPSRPSASTLIGHPFFKQVCDKEQEHTCVHVTTVSAPGSNSL